MKTKKRIHGEGPLCLRHRLGTTDTPDGWPGRSILIAERGTAHVESHRGNGLLIGTTAFDANEAALLAVLVE